MGLNKPKAVFLLFFLLLISGAFALTIGVPKGGYSKLEFIDINGIASGELVEVIVTSSPGNKTVFSDSVKADSNGIYFLRHFISCIDPAGDWKITVTDRAGTEERIVYVSSSVECEYLRVDFIDPSSSSYFRTQKFDVRVKITDAGTPVNNAEAYFWDFEGKKTRMYFEGNGIYFFDEVEIPVNAQTEKMNLMVASLAGGKETAGGSNVVVFDVRLVPIKIELINPVVEEFDFGQPLELKVKPVYPDGSVAEKVEVSVEFNNEKIKLVKGDAGVFYAVIPTADFNSEIFYLTVLALDAYGNSGTASLSLEPKGHLYFLLAQNAVVYVFPVIFVLYVLFVSFKEGKIFVKRLLVKRERKKLFILMKKLQDDYFNNQIISREVYFQQFENYDRERTELENKLIELKRKQELK